MFKTWLQPSPGPRTRLSVSFCVVLYVRTSFHVIDWTVMAVVVLLLRSRRPGIRCQTVFVAQLRVASAENSLMRNNDETYLEIFCENALCKFDILLTLLTYFLHNNNNYNALKSVILAPTLLKTARSYSRLPVINIVREFVTGGFKMRKNS